MNCDCNNAFYFSVQNYFVIGKSYWLTYDLNIPLTIMCGQELTPLTYNDGQFFYEYKQMFLKTLCKIQDKEIH